MTTGRINQIAIHCPRPLSHRLNCAKGREAIAAQAHAHSLGSNGLRCVFAFEVSSSQRCCCWEQSSEKLKSMLLLARCNLRQEALVQGFTCLDRRSIAVSYETHDWKQSKHLRNDLYLDGNRDFSLATACHWALFRVHSQS